MISSYYVLFVSCFLLLAICYFISDDFYLKLAITCKKLFPLAPVVQLVIFQLDSLYFSNLHNLKSFHQIKVSRDHSVQRYSYVLDLFSILEILSIRKHSNIFLLSCSQLNHITIKAVPAHAHIDKMHWLDKDKIVTEVFFIVWVGRNSCRLDK